MNSSLFEYTPLVARLMWSVKHAQRIQRPNSSSNVSVAITKAPFFHMLVPVRCLVEGVTI